MFSDKIFFADKKVSIDPLSLFIHYDCILDIYIYILSWMLFNIKKQAV